MSGKGFIAPELETVCELCGKIDECRPYGPNSEQICFECGISTPEMAETVEKKMQSYIFGENND